MKNKFLYYGLAFLSLHSATHCAEKTLGQKIKTVVGETLTYPLSAGDATAGTTQYAQNLYQQLDSTAQLTKVKKLGKWAQYLFGYKNTISVPVIDYLLVSEDWINNLPEEQKRFVVGRGLTWLKKGVGYLATQAALGTLGAFIAWKNSDIKVGLFNGLRQVRIAHSDLVQYQQTHPWNTEDPELKSLAETYVRQIQGFAIGDPDKYIPALGLLYVQFLKKCLDIYINRAIVYDADAYTAQKFNCHQGAIETINDLQNFQSDGSTDGKMFSMFPITYLYSKSVKNSKTLRDALSYVIIQEPLNNSSKFHSVFATGLEMLNSYMPGRLHNTPSRIGHAFKNLPIVNLLSNFPQRASRITALQNLKKATAIQK